MTFDSSPPPRISDYQIGPELGRGAMSIVYRATRDGTDFAIKVMAQDTAADAIEVGLGFRREAAAIARLNHPSLVRVLEVGETESRPYLVMELAEGEPLDRTIARKLLDDTEAVRIARAIAEALVEVHRFGLVHRDIKPANIVVSSSGLARLIDFGLVTGTAETDVMVGTLVYASPEQVGVMKRAVGPAADLYSLGATLFECLTGRPPIEAGADGDYFHLLITQLAPELLAVRPSTRPGLSAIVARLLAKDPDDRYQSARGLLHDLDNLAVIDAAILGGSKAQLGARDASMSADSMTPLVGRAVEVTRLESAWKRAHRGGVGFVRIEGESGSGKTRLAAELVARAEKDGALVLQGKCQELETVPFGPLREAADQYAARVLRFPDEMREAAIAQIRKAAGDWAPLVKRLAMGLSRLIGETAEMRPLDPDAEQQRYYEALGSFFRNLGTAESPLLLVVDDIQWLDEGSLRVLGRLGGAREGDGAHLLVLANARSAAMYEAARTRFGEAIQGRPSERIELQALGRDAIEALITARLGGRPLHAPVVDKLAMLTRGNPFAVGEYLRALLDAGVVRPIAGSWHANPDDVDAVKLPKDVLDLVVSRIVTLGPEASRLIGLASVIGGRFSVNLLEAASGASSKALVRSLEEMVRAGLIERVFGDTYSFIHDRVREAAIERLGRIVRKDLHQVVAETLDKQAELSATDLYAIARHYAEGHMERNPRRVAETNLVAGLRALEDHANEEAFELLDFTLTAAREAGTFDEMAMRLLEGLGRAAAMTGRLDRAFEHLEEALRLARDNKDRFRLQYLLTLTYASQGRNDDGLAALYRAFEYIGRPYPKSVLGLVLMMLYSWVLAIVLRWTGIGHGSAKGEDRERRQILSQLHYAGSMIALLQGRPFLMVQFIVRDFFNVHFLGTSAETAVASAVFGSVLGTFQFRGIMRRYTRIGIEMAEQLGDRSAHAICRMYEAAGIKWAGDLVRGNEMMLAVLPDVHRHAPGSWYAAMAMTEQAYSFLHGGLSSAAIEHVKSSISQLERTNNLMFRYNTLSVQYAEMMVSGDIAEATPLWVRLEEQYKPISKTIYARLARCIAVLEVLIDTEETGPEVDDTIHEFHELVSEDYYSNAARMLAGYARLVQYEKASEATRPAARKRLEQAILGASLRAMVPVFQIHPFVWRAVLARHDGKHTKARRLLERADRLATRAGSRRGAFYVARERARLALATGDSAARFFAMEALEVAQSEKWRLKIQRIRTEFGLAEERKATIQATAHATTHVSSTAGGVSAEQAKRYVEALLQVSLASASSLDVESQAKNALVEVARVLGAERALFFLIDPVSGELELKASTGAGAENISSTAVRKVIETRAPYVSTGDEKGEALGSASIMAHGIRSILAAPLMFRERLIGAVYLDSRLAKSIFTKADVDLLLAVSNHIAIAVETARSARIEVERSAMLRDLEILGVVQNLLLPKAQVFETDWYKGASFYQPATQCGGDWWWYEALPNGTLMILMGDVSGHGAGPAMVTGAVAGAFHALCHLPDYMEPRAILEALDRQVRAFGGGFHMTLSLLRLDASRQEMGWWNAAAPPLFLTSARGSDCLSSRGNMLGGVGGFDVAETFVPFLPGDRLLLCTDGLIELKQANGRDLGTRRVLQLFARSNATSIHDLPRSLGAQINALLAGRPQDDDITLVVLEALQPCTHPTLSTNPGCDA